MSHRYSGNEYLKTSPLARWLGIGLLSIGAWRARRSASEAVRKQHLTSVARRMASLKGLPQKLGQIVSGISSPDSDNPLAELTDSGAPFPANTTFVWIEQELGCSIRSVFQWLKPTGFAASIGQVHHGALLDGREVAVKIQYPDIEKALDADLACLKLLMQPMSRKTAGFNLDGYRSELRRSLLREVDYVHEAATLREVFNFNQERLDIVTPEPIEALCTDRLLVMTWIDGAPLSAASTWSDEKRQIVAKRLLSFFLESIFERNEIHGDPHDGNFRVIDGSSDCPTTLALGVLDFGCVQQLLPSEVNSIQALVTEDFESEPDKLLAHFLTLGFSKELLAPICTKLWPVTKVLTAPFRTSGHFNLDEWCLSESITSILGDDRWNLRFAGPPHLLLFVRALSGLIVQIKRLNTSIDWWSELSRVLGVRERDCGDMLGQLPTESSAESPLPTTTPFTGRVLRIQLDEGGKTKVRLTLGAHCVENLADFVPDDVTPLLAREGIDVSQLAASTISRGYPLGDLFSWSKDGKEVRIWIDQNSESSLLPGRIEGTRV